MKPHISYVQNKIYTRKMDSYTKKIRKMNQILHLKIQHKQTFNPENVNKSSQN